MKGGFGGVWKCVWRTMGSSTVPVYLRAANFSSVRESQALGSTLIPVINKLQDIFATAKVRSWAGGGGG